MEILLVDQAVHVDQQPEVYDQAAKGCTGKQQRFFSVGLQIRKDMISAGIFIKPIMAALDDARYNVLDPKPFNVTHYLRQRGEERNSRLL
jgi:hypothetical protein